MRNKKDVTIYDIAKSLNLSTSTVSRALNNNPTISKKTIKKIHKTAKAMGYQPNTLAASLRGNKVNTIGVLISRIDRPFISSLISGIESTAQKAGYNVIITQCHDSYEEEVTLAQTLYSNRVSGIICSLGMNTRDTSHFQQFIDKGIPLVFVDRVPKDFDTYKVMIDNYAAGYKATKHLIEQGCKKIAHFAGSQIRNIYSERKRGYIDALKENNLVVDESLIIYFNRLGYAEGINATKKLLSLKNPPDGIFSPNDITAVAAIKTAKKMGVRIPEELAIIGFNDDPIATIVDPELSSITHPAKKMGSICAKKILNHLKNKKTDDVVEITLLNTKLVVRASSKRN